MSYMPIIYVSVNSIINIHFGETVKIYLLVLQYEELAMASQRVDFSSPENVSTT